MTKRLVVVAITRDEARIWKTGIEPRSKAETVHAPSEGVHHHVRTAQFHSGHGTDHASPEYFEEIATAIQGFEEILLVGHGKGKASSMLHLIQYLERKHPVQAKKVVDALDTDLENLSEGEILALAREWSAKYQLMI